MADWATDTNYSGLPGDQAVLNGTPTKVEPSAAEKANGFVPGDEFIAQKANWVIANYKAVASHAYLYTPDAGADMGNGTDTVNVATTNRTTLNSSDFTIAAAATGPVTYTGATTKRFKITVDATFKSTATGGTWYVTKNGSQIGPAHSWTSTTNVIRTVVVVVDLAQNDTIWLEKTGGTAVFTCEEVSLVVEEIFS